MADRLRGSMDSGEYKNVVLGLLFLKYVSDAFEELYEQLKVDTVIKQAELMAQIEFDLNV